MPFRFHALAAQATFLFQHASSVNIRHAESTEPEQDAAQIPKRANVLMIMADQFRADHMNPELTPNLWRLTERGVNFKKAFVSTPICPAARASLLSGLSPWRHGLRGYGEIPPRYEDELAGFFGRHGYTTGSVGKNHFGQDENGLRYNHGYSQLRTYEGLQEEDDYDRWFQEMRPGEDPLKSGGISCTTPGPDAPNEGPAPHEDWCWNTWKSTTYEYPEPLHPTVWTADEAIRYLSTAGKGPWFIKVSFHRPHSPYDPPQRVFDETPEADRPPFISMDGWDHEFRDNCSTPGVRDSTCGEVSPEELSHTRRAYRAAVRHVDEQAGRVLSMIDPKTTWVLFLSDHGDMQNDHYIWRKSVPYQGAVHIPMVLAWPTTSYWAEIVQPGARYDLVELRDVFPTLVRAVELQLSEEDEQRVRNLDGIDARCALVPDDDLKCTREFLDMEHGINAPQPRYYNWNALTDGYIKYILFSDGAEQLFNLTADPREEYELARLDEYKEEVEKWRIRMAQHFAKEGRGPLWVQDDKLVSTPPHSVTSPNYPRRMTAQPEDFLLQDYEQFVQAQGNAARPILQAKPFKTRTRAHMTKRAQDHAQAVKNTTVVQLAGGAAPKKGRTHRLGRGKPTLAH